MAEFGTRQVAVIAAALAVLRYVTSNRGVRLSTAA
jgi:hypothetical protein